MGAGGKPVGAKSMENSRSQESSGWCGKKRSREFPPVKKKGGGMRGGDPNRPVVEMQIVPITEKFPQ